MAHWLLLAAALVLSGAGLGLWLWLGAARRGVGLPEGRVTYVDPSSLDHCERPLFSPRLRLTGRPDYLVKTRRGVVPVEAKSSAAPLAPYDGHVLQLAAYCLLVEEQERIAPEYGVIMYRDRSFEVPYTPELRSRLLAILESMRGALHARDVARDHGDPSRCRSCGYREPCDRRLG